MCLSLVPFCMDVPALGFAAFGQAKIVLCFLHEWGLHPSYVTDNGGNVGGKNGGKNGGVPSLCPAVPSFVTSLVTSLVPRRRKECKY